MDEVDGYLLESIQQNNHLSQADLGEQTGLSTPGIHKRLKKLRQEGYIKRDVALLDRGKLGLDLLCFLKVMFKQNLNAYNYDKLRAALEHFPEVLECHALTGSDDAIMKVLVRDHASLKDFLQRFSEVQDFIGHIQTSIVLEEIKTTTALPLNQVQAKPHK